MEKEIKHGLEPVRRQFVYRNVIDRATTALVIGAGAGCLLGVIRLLTAGAVPVLFVVALMVTFPVLAALWAVSHRSDPHRLAHRVDQHYRLKDRTLTALALSEQKDTSKMAEIQVRDAIRQLAGVRPADVVGPLRPSRWPEAIVLSAIVVCLLAWPISVEIFPPEEYPHIAPTQARRSTLLRVEPQLAAESCGKIRVSGEKDVGFWAGRLGKRGEIERFFKLTQSHEESHP